MKRLLIKALRNQAERCASKGFTTVTVDPKVIVTLCDLALGSKP